MSQWHLGRQPSDRSVSIVLGAHRIIGFLKNLNYPQINGVGNSDHIDKRWIALILTGRALLPTGGGS